MPSLFAGLFTAVHIAGTAGTLQSELQGMLNQLSESNNVGLQLGWKSATESFTIAAGTVTNPGESSRAITPDDTFNYGSGTKATIATAVMRMADAGKFKLSDKVSTYVDPFLKRNNGTTLEELFGPQMADATVLQVLRMEAGIPDFEGQLTGFGAIDSQALKSDGQVFPPYAWLRAAASKQPVCSPGSCSFYSSANYEVAGLLLAAVQKPDGDWDDLDFGKALASIEGNLDRYPSMKLPGSQGKLKDTLSVAGFSTKRSCGGLHCGNTTIWDQNPTIMGWSCGGMNANTGDFAKFFYDLLDESSPNPLVSAAARTEMTNFKVLTKGSFKISYGAGLMDTAPPVYNKPTSKGPEDWGYLIGHIGETFAFHAVNGYMPKAKAAISVVTNSDDGFQTPNFAACKASEIAAKVLAGATLDLGCGSSPGWGRQRRSVHRESSEGSEVIV